MPEPTAPVARTRNAIATRAAILQAARGRFARHGYDAASVRDIAADAGIDPALINRYFGSKEELFAQVLSSTAGPNDLTDGSLEDFGQRVARMLVYEDPRHDKLELLLILLMSAASPKAKELARRHGETTFHQPFEAWLGGEDAGVRARLASSVILGFVVSRTIDAERLLAPDLREELCARLADLLQRCVEPGRAAV